MISADAEGRDAVPGDTRTDRQRALFEFLFEETRRLGFQPSLRQLAAFLGSSNSNAAITHLEALHKKGWIRHEPGGGKGSAPARCIEILRRPDGSPFDGFR